MKFLMVASGVAVASAIPLQPALIELERPTFAKGIPTACEYTEHPGRNLGHIYAEGHSVEYDNLEEAKAKCDEIGPNCGGVVEKRTAKDVEEGATFELMSGRRLFVGETDIQFAHLKGLCAFPIPNTNFPHTNNKDTIAEVENLRWKLSNGPSFARLDDGRDHGSASRLPDGKYDVFEVDDCIEQCAQRSDCQSGHYCAVGKGGAAGVCYLSGDWSPYGDDSAEGCMSAQNFKKTHDWVKPVMRTEAGEYVKEQWHSKETRDNAAALKKEAEAESIPTESEEQMEKEDAEAANGP